MGDTVSLLHVTKDNTSRFEKDLLSISALVGCHYQCVVLQLDKLCALLSNHFQ